MQTMPFDDWVRAWFDHPESWDWLDEYDLPELEPNDTLAYATRLFLNVGVVLACGASTASTKRFLPYVAPRH